MKKIFSSEDFNDSSLASCFDELPLWSAPFGIKLLDSIDYSNHVNALDIGCGTGFPLIEMAQRFGNQSQFAGIDPWVQGLDRIREKIQFYEIENISLSNSYAENLPFEDSTFTLITSNNGLNNVDSIEKSLKECYRVAHNKAKLVFTANLPGTFLQFYETLKTVLTDNGMYSSIAQINRHINHKRKCTEEMSRIILESGFKFLSVQKDTFQFRFTSGTSFFNHFLIRLYFLNSWKSILPEIGHPEVLKLVEKKLNILSSVNNGLCMEVPFALYNAEK